MADRLMRVSATFLIIFLVLGNDPALYPFVVGIFVIAVVWWPKSENIGEQE